MTDTKLSKAIRAEDLTLALLNEYARGQGWRFAWNRRKRARGVCHYSKRTVELSRNILDDPWEAIENTIRHEIAHVIAGKAAGHGPAWKMAAVRVGAKPERCGPKFAAEVPHKYEIRCSCRTYPRHRVTRQFRASLARRRCPHCEKGFTLVSVSRKRQPA